MVREELVSIYVEELRRAFRDAVPGGRWPAFWRAVRSRLAVKIGDRDTPILPRPDERSRRRAREGRS